MVRIVLRANLLPVSPKVSSEPAMRMMAMINFFSLDMGGGGVWSPAALLASLRAGSGQ